MANYTYYSHINSPNYNRGRGPVAGRKLKIVLHHFGEEDTPAESAIGWLCNPASGVSANYVVSGDKVWCLVDPDDTAWHSGDYETNRTSIGIECNPKASSLTVKTLLNLMYDLAKFYNIDTIIGHKDVVNTECPGKYYALLPTLKQDLMDKLNLKAEVPAVPRVQTMPAPTKPENTKGVNRDGKNIPINRGYNYTMDELVEMVKLGRWENGPRRFELLRWYGYDADMVQAKVNESLGIRFTMDQLIRKILRGDYGNGETRYRMLKNQGYDAQAVQNRINYLAATGELDNYR